MNRPGEAGVVPDDLGVVGGVELVEPVPVDLDLTLGEDDLLVLVDLDDLVVELIADQDWPSLSMTALVGSGMAMLPGRVLVA